jgi:ATP-dependent Clp protease protease subunit
MKILVNFFGDVSETSVNQMITFVTQNVFAVESQKQQVEELIIQIASNGGSSDHGLLAYNFLRQMNVKKTTINIGNVDSAAALIFCAGDARLAMQTSRFTLHGAMTTIQGQFSGSKLQEIADLNKRITDDYVKVIADTTRKNKSSLKKKIDSGYVIDAQESKNIGLVTELLDKPYLESTNGITAMIINNPVPPPQNKQQNVQA